jgi:GNAT superfamily N-acetyltransferase
MVARQQIDVRRAGAGDLEDLLRLWSLAREDVGPMGRPLIVTAPEQVRPRLRASLCGDDVQVAIARWDGRPAGFTLVRVVPVAALLEGLAVQVEHLYVVPELRRHGVAKALLGAVIGIAERVGAEQVFSSAPPGARDSHRFLARLGFSPVVIRRVAATSVLRRKLAGEGRRGGLEDLLSRRRSLRARADRPRRGECPPLLAEDLAGGGTQAGDGTAVTAETGPAGRRPTGAYPAEGGAVRSRAVAGSAGEDSVVGTGAAGEPDQPPVGEPAAELPGGHPALQLGERPLVVRHEAVAGTSTATV